MGHEKKKENWKGKKKERAMTLWVRFEVRLCALGLERYRSFNALLSRAGGGKKFLEWRG